MSAHYLWTVAWMSPGEVMENFIHGYTDKDFVTFCIFPWDPGAVEEQRRPEAAASMSEGDVVVHVDGTIGHHVFVTSNSTNRHLISVDIYELRETVPNPP